MMDQIISQLQCAVASGFPYAQESIDYLVGRNCYSRYRSANCDAFDLKKLASLIPVIPKKLDLDFIGLLDMQAGKPPMIYLDGDTAKKIGISEEAVIEHEALHLVLGHTPLYIERLMVEYNDPLWMEAGGVYNVVQLALHTEMLGYLESGSASTDYFRSSIEENFPVMLYEVGKRAEQVMLWVSAVFEEDLD